MPLKFSHDLQAKSRGFQARIRYFAADSALFIVVDESPDADATLVCPDRNQLPRDIHVR